MTRRGDMLVPNTGGTRRDEGSTSLSVALLTPLFVVLAFAAVQAALWGHALTEARVVARDTAALVARAEVSPGDARSAAESILRTDTDLAGIVVSVKSSAGVVTVSVRGRAPGIMRGTSAPIVVTEALPVEEPTP